MLTSWTLTCGLGGCIRAPALIVAARSTFGTGDRRPLRVVVMCGLDWSKSLQRADHAASVEPSATRAEGEIEELTSAEFECALPSLCDWEARARQAALLQTLAGLAEVEP